MEDKQASRWLLTFDNIDKHDITHELIKKSLELFSIKYYCMQDEVTDAGMKHTHLYFETTTNTRFSTIKKRFPNITHIDKALGTAKENKDYIQKQGKYKDSEKSLTSLPDTFEEYGSIDETIEENKINKNELLINYIEQGLTNYQIIKIAPQYTFRLKEMDVIRYNILKDKYSKQRRKLTVTYLYGTSGAGKTRSIFDTHDGNDICRITSYRKDKGIYFDSYGVQKVLVFEEFHSQVPIEEMLNYLDIYPLNLPARYSDRVACYTEVYITSNISLESQYKDIQKKRPEQWKAFLRRIDKVIEYKPDGTTIEKQKPNVEEKK